MGLTRGMWGIFIGSGSGDGRPGVSSFWMEGVRIQGLLAHHGTGIQEELFVPSHTAHSYLVLSLLWLHCPCFFSLWDLQPYSHLLFFDVSIDLLCHVLAQQF